MRINETGDAISEWLKSILTPDKMQTVQDFIHNRFSEIVQHKLDLYLGYLGLVKGEFVQHLNSPMPDVWTDTVGKAFAEFLKGMGG